VENDGITDELATDCTDDAELQFLSQIFMGAIGTLKEKNILIELQSN